MLPEPLHPAVVHFPIVLATLLPVAVSAAIYRIHRGEGVRRVWAPVLILTLALTGSSWAAVETGERDEEAVEAWVSESAIHEHEEAAELFLAVSVGVTILIGLGFVAGKVGMATRGAAVVATLALVGLGYSVGHSGGELVYAHGAASAFSSRAPSAGGPADLEEEDREDEEGHDHQEESEDARSRE